MLNYQAYLLIEQESRCYRDIICIMTLFIFNKSDFLIVASCITNAPEGMTYHFEVGMIEIQLLESYVLPIPSYFALKRSRCISKTCRNLQKNYLQDYILCVNVFVVSSLEYIEDHNEQRVQRRCTKKKKKTHYYTRVHSGTIKY